jgi:SAM-dependent methyltransferase
MTTTDRSPESHAAAREYFDETADTYAAHADARTSDLTSLIFARRKQTVLELLDDSGVQGTLLDFGMGPGVFAAEVVDRGFHFVGVDISPEMVERAEALGIPHTTYAVGDLDELERFRGTADAVIAIGLIDYLEDTEAGLRRLTDCLRPGGVLIVSFRNAEALNTGLRAVAKRIWRRFFGRSRWRAQTAFVAPVHEKPFTPRRLFAILGGFGMVEPVVRYHSANPILFFNVPLKRGLWSRWLRFDRRVSGRVPRLLCDAGVLRMRKAS